MTVRWKSNGAVVGDRALGICKVENGQLLIAPDPREDRFVAIYDDGKTLPPPNQPPNTGDMAFKLEVPV